MSQVRTIKKYSNRRLYDTEESSYVTLAEVRQLIIDGTEIHVVDVVSGEDITRQILIQIISEQETGGQPMFTEELLTKMIRFYGGAFQSVFTDYLGKTVEMLNNQQQAYHQQWRDMLNADSMASVSEMTQQNIERWNEMQRELATDVRPATTERKGLSPKPSNSPACIHRKDLYGLQSLHVRSLWLYLRRGVRST